MEASSYLDLLPRDVESRIEYILENQPFNIKGLPLELQEYVLLQLSYPDVIRLRGINTTFREIIDKDMFWKLKTRRDFGVPKEAPKVDAVTGEPVESWKEVYLSHGKLLEKDLFQAINSNDSRLVQDLIDLGVNPNIKDKDDFTPLTKAAWEGYSDIIRTLLNAGVDPNFADGHGDTALIQASYGGRAVIIKMLLEAGADPNLAGMGGEDSALGVVSCMWNYTDIANMLLEYGANPDLMYDGRTALLCAAKNGNLELIKRLLDRGADPNLASENLGSGRRTDYGLTPLMAASARGRTDIVRMLLNAGANLNLEDGNGRTALRLASIEGHRDIVKILKDAEKFQNEKSSSKKSSGSLDLKTLKVKELRSIAKKYKIKGRSKATTKDKLITLLRDNLSSEDLSREINSFRPDRSFAPRTQSSGNQYILSPSTRSGKKWSIQTPTGTTVHFGSAGMSDYTIHKDPERKERYIKRHAGNSNGKTSRREKWEKAGLDTPGFWSRWLLWGEPSLQGSINKIEKDFGIDIVKRSQSPRNPRRRNRY